MSGFKNNGTTIFMSDFQAYSWFKCFLFLLFKSLSISKNEVHVNKAVSSPPPVLPSPYSTYLGFLLLTVFTANKSS